MAHDFAKKRAADAKKRSGNAPASPWLWFLSGIIIGALGSFLVYLATLAPHPDRPAPAVAKATEPAAAPEEKQPARRAEKPQFDFYTLLPETEVLVGEPSQPQTSEAKSSQTTPESPPPESSKPAAQFLLQAGSFRQFADADRRRAEILLLGFDARVETVTVRGGETWHRVHVGPFPDPTALTRARNSLRGQGIETLEISKRSG